MLVRLGHWLDACKRLTIVAVCTTTYDAGMFHRPAGKTTRTGIARRMAGLACQACRQVVYRLGNRRHARKHLTVVASRATTGDTGVNHHSRVIARSIMAKRTRRSRRQVIGRLAATGRNRKAGGRSMTAFARRRPRRSVGRRRRLG